MRISKPIERWFPAPKDPDNSEHLIRHLTPGENEDVYSDFSNQETKYMLSDDKDMTPEVTQTADIGKISERLRVLSIVDWKNMFDEKEDTLECTEENKVRALREIEGYKEFIDECRKQLADDIKKENEVLEKN